MTINGYGSIVGIVITLVAQTLGIVWWAAGLSSQVRQLRLDQEQMEARLLARATIVDNAVSRLTVVETNQLRFMERYLDRWEENPPKRPKY